MDNEVEASFYKEEISKLIEETNDLDLLDLIYKILAEVKN